MAAGDILFILLFIVLPTAVIVSGFWIILFVIRNPEHSRESSIIVNSVEEAATEVDSAPSDEQEQHPVVAKSASDESETKLAEAVPQTIDELNPVVADLLSDEATRIEKMTSDSQTANQIADESASETTATGVAKIYPTEEIPAVADPLLVDLTNQDQTLTEPDDLQGNIVQNETWRNGLSNLESSADDTHAESKEIENMTVDLAGIGDVQEETTEKSSEVDEAVEKVEQSDTESGADLEPAQPSSHQTESRRALLVPSHAAERKNRRKSRTGGRQVPQLNRSIRPDESEVERGDGVSDF